MTTHLFSPPVLSAHRSRCCLQKLLGFVTLPADAYRHPASPISAFPHRSRSLKP
jgi:hypothetical protein